MQAFSKRTKACKISNAICFGEKPYHKEMLPHHQHDYAKWHLIEYL